MLAAYVFAQNRPEVIEAFSQNRKLKEHIYLLKSNEHWKVPAEGLLLLDIEKFLLNGRDYENPQKKPIINSKINIKISTHKHLQKKCGCCVSYLPDELAVKYIKMIAQKTCSLAAIVMEHERGDTLYDVYCWVFDFRKHTNDAAEKEYLELSDYVRFYPADKEDLKTPSEFIYACYDSMEGYDNFYMTGCPARVKEKWDGASMLAFDKLNEIFEIEKFPYWVDLYNYDLTSYRI